MNDELFKEVVEALRELLEADRRHAQRSDFANTSRKVEARRKARTILDKIDRNGEEEQ